MTQSTGPSEKELLRLQRRLAKSDRRRAELEHLIDTGQAFQRSVLAQVERARADLQILNNKLQNEQARSDRLLRSIMPDFIADELKRHDSVVPRRAENATVMFADFVGFTASSETLDPLILLQILDHYYSGFDRIAARHSIEKVKTIGDAYMCVAGLNDDPASIKDMVNAARDFIDFVASVRPAALDPQGPLWQIRIGISSGPVSVGVIGQDRLSFDVWGDTVNTAARIVGAATPNGILLSQSSFDLLPDTSGFAHHDSIAAKGRGNVEVFRPTR